MINSTIINDTLDILSAKATAFDSYLTEAKATALDAKSAHTWHGVPEAVVENLNEAINLIDLALLKVKSAV
jgi:hypothetical protein